MSRLAEDCDLPTDIIIQSCDGGRFGGHSQTLGVFSEGFPLPGSITVSAHPDDVVVLSENSQTLRILLQWMHSTLPPNIHKLPFAGMESLAEAAEKYMVGTLCRTTRRAMECVVQLSGHIFRLMSVNSSLFLVSGPIEITSMHTHWKSSGLPLNTA